MTTYLEGDIPRAERITEWLATNAHCSYVIIDDIRMNLKNTVLVDPRHGLSDVDVEKALAFLHVQPVINS